MDFLTDETEYFSLPDSADSVISDDEIINPIDDNESFSSFLNDPEQEEISVPDAIEIDNDVSIPDIVSEERISEMSSEAFPNGSGPAGANPLQKETDGTISDTLGNIYKVLNERLPEKESEPETEILEQDSETVQETEISLTDIYNEINSINEIESEQLGVIQEIRDNKIISSNNNYHLASFQIAITSASLGAFLIYLFFRKIS